MGWWHTGIGDDIIGDGPADSITDALHAIVSQRRQRNLERLTLKQLLEAVAKAISTDSDSFLSDVNGRTAGPIVANRGTPFEVRGTKDADVDFTVLHELLHRFSEIAAEYQDTELERKPRLSELLAALGFVLRPSPSDYLAHCDGLEIDSITSEWIQS